MNQAALADSRMMKAVRCERADTTPVWIMRQAGRYLPEYMEVRSHVKSVLELCRRPDLAAEVTLSAQHVLGVDAAILFADLPPLLIPMGFDLTYEPGPTIHNPLRIGEKIDRVRAIETAEEMGEVMETARLVRAGLPDEIPLIGFAGAPFTLASYAIEGGGSRDFQHTKTLMFADPGAWDALMRRVVESLIVYLRGQIAAGCQLVQLFDSWGGCLSPADYRRYVLPHSQAVIRAIEPHAPVIHFLTGNPALLLLMREAGGQVMGIDWRVDLNEAWRTVGHDVAVQGNLDPVSLFAELDV
ncbi:MAG: uroporphyrinogen decarboxylase, partial [Planctomycetaceae bacterium]|nr:uroporphyrinogen decarboxylase [Planctomycetaceae bacterium]